MIISSTNCAKVKSYKKKLKELELVEVRPSHLYFPLKWRGHEAKMKVKTGSLVKKGDLLCTFPAKEDLHIFASASGKIEKNAKVDSGESEEKIEAIKLKVKNFSDAKLLPPMDYIKSTPSKLIARIKQTGIVGLGGAGFPTHVKLAGKNIHTLVINAVECEPMLISDYYAMLNYTEKLVRGIAIAAKANGVKKVIVGIKRVSKLASIKIKEEIDKQSLSKLIKIKFVKNRYPVGWEKNLVKTTTGTSYVNGPYEEGITVLNSTTCLAIDEAITKGETISNKIITISGNAVSKSAIAIVPVGTLISDCLKSCDVKIVKKDHSIQLGGPMMGNSLVSTTAPIELVTSGIIVNELIDYDKVKTICAKCGKCTSNCPASLQPNIINSKIRKNDFNSLKYLEAEKCVTCGLCAWNCPSRLPLVTGLVKAQKIAKNRLKTAGAVKKG